MTTMTYAHLMTVHMTCPLIDKDSNIVNEIDDRTATSDMVSVSVALNLPPPVGICISRTISPVCEFTAASYIGYE